MEKITEWATLIASVLVIVGGVFAAFQLWLMTRQGHRTFESLYVQRYWHLMDQLSSEVQFAHPEVSIEEEERRVLFAYVQLCEDEADLYVQGRVTHGTWHIWKTGIDEMLKIPAVVKLLEQAPASRFDTLRSYIRHGELSPKFRGFLRIIRGL